MREEIKVYNYLNAIKVLHEKNKEYDILIDFHDKRKWISSNTITLTLISSQDSTFTSKTRGDQKGKGREGIYIIDTTDNSIKYICDIHGRYEYYFKGNALGLNENGYGSINLANFITTRDDYINLLNVNSDVLVDNGKNKEENEFPYIENIDPENKWVYKYHPTYGNSKRKYSEEKTTSGHFIIKNREDGGLDIYDERSGMLYYVCNIGKRYEYYRKGEFKDCLSKPNYRECDILIKLIPDKEKLWITVMYSIDPDNNPYVIRERSDGGVDLLSKKDGSLKYVCNIGKRFYYITADDNKSFYY
jgi:hypothetical protein